MKKFTDSLRGYGRKIFERDKFICAYCGEDHSSFKMWRFLTVDHLLPVGHPNREKSEWKVTACSFCNTAKNRTKYEITEKTTPQDLINMKKKEIKKTTDEYYEFWNENYNKSL